MARARRELGHVSRIEERLVEDARAFITIGPDSPLWKLGWDTSADANILGAFVRLEPPPDASDETVAKMKREAERKALRVVVLPRRRPAEVLAPREKKPHRKAREVVAELVAEANLPDEGCRAALVELVELIMSRRGL